MKIREKTKELTGNQCWLIASGSPAICGMTGAYEIRINKENNTRIIWNDGSSEYSDATESFLDLDIDDLTFLSAFQALR